MSSTKFIARNGLAVGTTPTDIVDSTGTLLINAPTSTKLLTARTISLSGDVAGSVSFDGTGNVDISTTIQANSVALGTDTTGNYMVNVAAGTGVSVSHTQGEGSTATVSIGQAVGTTDNVTFNNVTVNGTLTSDDITSTNISVAGNATITGNLTVSGTTTTVNSTTIALADANLELARNATTAAQANGAGITVTGPTTPATITYTSADDRWNLNKNLNVTTVYGALSGNATTASTWQTARTLSYTGDATGSMSVNGGADVSAALTLANSGVTAGSYGSSTAIPVLTIDAKGRVTSASTSAITVGAGTLGVSIGTAGATNTTVTWGTSTGFNANTSSNYTYDLKVGPALTALATLMTSGSAGFIKRTGVDTYSIDTNTYLTSYTETDTLATVTARGNSTSTNIGSTSGTALALATAGNIGTWIGGISDGTSGWALSQATIGFKSDNNTYAAIGIGTAQGILYFGRTTSSGVGTMSSWLEVDSGGIANFKRARPQYNGSNLALVSEIPSVSGFLTGTKVDSITATSPIVASASTGAVTLSHASSGVTAGTYNNVTVNALGHVTSGSNTSYLTSYTETDTLATVTARGATTSSAILIGPNSSSRYTRFGGNGGQTDEATVSASNGNLHIDSKAGNGLYLNHYSSGDIITNNAGGVFYNYTSVRSPIFYDYNDTTYYLDPASYSRIRQLTLTNARVDSSKFPIGHYTPGQEVFAIDPTWTVEQLREYFGSNSVSWVADSTAPGGYAISIAGAVNVGNNSYSSGFPWIPVETDDTFYMECYVKDVSGTNTHYMGSIDFNESFSNLGGNPGSYGYWAMSNQGPGTSWTKFSGYISGFGTATGQFKAGTKYWTPQALFNYSGGGTTYISGWRVYRLAKGIVGRFPNSTTNSGEAWYGRANDRNRGAFTIQLGGGSSSGRTFEVVDYAWSSVMFSVDSGNYASAAGSFRAPLFYDSNNTAYYADPDGNSQFWGLRIRGDASSAATDNQITFWGSGSASTTSAIGFKSNSAPFTNPTGNGDGYNTYFTMDTDGRGWVFRRGTGGTDFTSAYTAGWLLNNGVAQFNSSMRAPIFYDSNNTSYYIDPNSVSVVNDFRINDGNVQLRSANVGRNTKWRALEGSTDVGISFYDANDRWVMQLYANYGSSEYGFLNGNWASWDLRKVANGSLFMNNNNSYYLRTDSDSYMYRVYGAADIRSPIFYDNNDTAYYADPNSTSSFNKLTMSNAVSTQSGGGLRNVMPGGGAYATGTSSVSGAIVITLPTTNYPMVRFTVKVYTYDGLSFDISCGGHTSSGTWYNTFAHMNTQNRSAMNVRFCYGNGVTYVYIGDLGSSWSYPQVFITDVQVGYSTYGIDQWNSGWSIGFNTSTYNNVSATHTVYPPTSSSNNSNAAYASILYDANNTTYYCDPAGSTSLSAGGQIRAANYGSAGTAFSMNWPHSGWIDMWGASSQVMNISSASGLAVNLVVSGNITANSDIRIKTDIRKIENAIEKVKQINGVTYIRVDNESLGRQTGVIAQEVLEVLPEAVIKSDEDMYSVAYGNMVGLLIEAIKEQQSEIDELKSLVKQLLAK
jgi:hypothetical protein